MDPQQRLVLEHGYEALHSGGCHRSKMLGSLTGVFLGIENNDFAEILATSSAGDSVYAATGSSDSIASGRLSYILGLHGPSVSCATACSAALTACHAGMRALQMDECGHVLLAGVNLILLPRPSMNFAVAGMTSVRGRCHTFDNRADGYARGEGCVAAAMRCRDAGSGGKLGLLGSAVRQDGRSASLTAPSGLAQQGLLLAALNDAQLSRDELTVHEAHGTGTALGDPIEAGSLASAVLATREQALEVGGGKANIGHAEPAAGITGLLKLGL